MGGNPFCEWCEEERDTEVVEINGKRLSLCADCLQDWNERHEENPC